MNAISLPARFAGQPAFRRFGLTLYGTGLWAGPQDYRPGAAKFAPDLRNLKASRHEIEGRILCISG